MPTPEDEVHWVLLAQCHDRDALERLLRSVTEQSEIILRRSLDNVDRLRRRWLVTMGVTVALSQIAWLAFVLKAEQVTEKTLLILATFALAMTVFGGVFMLVVHTTRMTHQILQAIDLAFRR